MEKLNSSIRSVQNLEKIKGKFPAARCKKILEKNGKKFTEEEVLMVRDFLINVAEIAYKIFETHTNEMLDKKSGKGQPNE